MRRGVVLAMLPLTLTLAVGASAALATPRAKPGYVTGTAKSECGKPLASFVVSAYGFDGQPNVYPSGLPFLGSAKGSHGQYALRTVDSIRHVKPVNALVRGVEGYTTVTFHGHRYVLGLYPTDDKADGVGPADFSGHSGKGIVRNFLLRTTGLKPGFASDRRDAIDPGEVAQGAFYGGNITLELTLPSSTGSTLTVTLKPAGPLVDGCRAQTVTRSFKLGPYEGNGNVDLHNIPLDFYTMTATLRGSTSRALQLQVYPTNTVATSAPVHFLPTHDLPDGSSSVIVMVS